MTIFLSISYNNELKEIINDTVKLISESSEKIDVIIKQAEDEEKKEKKEIIKKYYESKNFNIISLDKIFNQKRN